MTSSPPTSGLVYHPEDTSLEICSHHNILFSISRRGGPALLVSDDGRTFLSKGPARVLVYKLEINWGQAGSNLRPFPFYEVDCVGKQFVNLASLLNLGWFTNEFEDDEKRLELTSLLGNPAKLIEDVCKLLKCETPKGIFAAYKDIPFRYKTPSKESFSNYLQYPYEEVAPETSGLEAKNLSSEITEGSTSGSEILAAST